MAGAKQHLKLYDTVAAQYLPFRELGAVRNRASLHQVKGNAHAPLVDRNISSAAFLVLIETSLLFCEWMSNVDLIIPL